jgi:hypothetical protein
MTVTDDLVKELRKAAYSNPGDWVCDMCGEAADRIEALTAENERLRELLDAWLGLAREHLDTELAGRTFEALERTRNE